jgi:hypothetical protein
MATDTKVPPYPAGPPTSQPPRKPDEEDDERRIYRNVAVCTRDPIPWIVGRLELGRADISRLQSSGIPILLGHVPNEVMGAVMAVRENADVWRSDWAIPRIPATRDTRDRMDTGLLKGVSVGGLLDWNSLEITNEDEVQNPDEWIFRADWVMLEQSLTAIPADVRAGIDRTMIARTGPIPDLFIGPDNGIYTPETPEIRQRLDSLMRQHNQNVSIRREQTMSTKALEQTIPQEAIERAISSQLERSESLKALAEVPAKLHQLTADNEAEAQRNMEYRAKLDSLQYQPHGSVLQMSNWSPMDSALDIGKILRLTAADDLGFPPLERSGSSLEESLLEQINLEAAGRSTVARIPFAAIEERQRQLMLQRNTLAGGGGARPVEVNISGDGGLLLSAFSPVLASMDVRSGLSGGQKLPYWTAQGSAAGGAEGSDIPVSVWTLADAELLPVSIATAFEISSSLRAADDSSFEALVYNSVQLVAGEELVKQILDGAGSGSNEIAGLWGRVSTATPDQVHEYGAAPSDCSRADILAVKNLVALSKTDGSPGSFILSTTMWQLCENILRGGTASDRYVLETMDGMGSGSAMVGVMEGRPAYHFQDFAPSGIVNPGLYIKPDRVTIFLWGRSFNLELVPVLARKDQYKLCVEANMAVIQPDSNLSAIRQT